MLYVLLAATELAGLVVVQVMWPQIQCKGELPARENVNLHVKTGTLQDFSKTVGTLISPKI